MSFPVFSATGFSGVAGVVWWKDFSYWCFITSVFKVVSKLKVCSKESNSLPRKVISGKSFCTAEPGAIVFPSAISSGITPAPSRSGPTVCMAVSSGAGPKLSGAFSGFAGVVVSAAGSAACTGAEALFWVACSNSSKGSKAFSMGSFVSGCVWAGWTGSGVSALGSGKTGFSAVGVVSAGTFACCTKPISFLAKRSVIVFKSSKSIMHV